MFDAIKDHVQRLGEWLTEGADEKTRAFDALSARVGSLEMIVTSLNARIGMLEHGISSHLRGGPIRVDDLKFVPSVDAAPTVDG